MREILGFLQHQGLVYVVLFNYELLCFALCHVNLINILSSYEKFIGLLRFFGVLYIIYVSCIIVVLSVTSEFPEILDVWKVA